MSRSLTRRLTDDAGLSMTELLVVLALLGMVLGVAYMLFGSVTGMTDRVEARTLAAEDGRRMLDRMTRELRQAREVVDGEGAFEDAQPRRCTFYCDLNHDGTPEKVRYRIVGKTLYRSEVSAASDVPPYTFGELGAEEVLIASLDGGWTGNVFTYYDNEDPAGEVPSGHPEDVSAVELKLVNSHTVGVKTAFVDLSTWVKVRSVHNTID